MSQPARDNSTEGATPPPQQQSGVNEQAGLGLHVTRATIDPGAPRGSGTATPSVGSGISTRESILAAHLDITPSLQKATHSVVKARNGSVLSRGLILKTDHYPSGECSGCWESKSQESRGDYRTVADTIRDLPAVQPPTLTLDLPLIVAPLSRKSTRS